MPREPGPTARGGGPPSRIGPFKILKMLGEGGMGVVYEAEQTSPVRRRVALKVIRTGYDTKQIVARFEAERQALAVMDHPSIARVYQAGTTEDGLPYFAMELVRGLPITDYCDMQKLSTGDRLRLFASVCRAVQHAHHKGVIHRDIKPSNVLVTVVDSQAIPKVIDFGIAKAIGQDLTGKTVVTHVGQLVGTPEYISPEQAEMSGLDIDSRTDIYSLGVMLYELLVGARPLDLRHVARIALWAAIREQTPPAPSARLSTLPGDTQEAIAKHRLTDVPDLRRTLRGDLDWVAMKCLEKDRTRRYETANGLALDIERFLAHKPVVARPPSAGYRARKFVRRHRAAVGGAVVALVAVVAGSAAAVTGMVRATRAEARALAEATAAQETAEFLEGLFMVADPGEAVSDTISVRTILDRGAERIRTELGDQPLTQARMMSAIGEAYTGLGRYREAEPLLERAIEIREQELGSDHLDVATTLLQIGNLRHMQGDYAGAEQALQRSLMIREHALGPDHMDVSDVLLTLGVSQTWEAKYDEAEVSLRRSLQLAEANLDQIDERIAQRLDRLATLMADQDRLQEAESLYLRAVDINTSVLGPRHPETAKSVSNLGTVYWRLGRYDEAETRFRQLLDINGEVFGPTNSRTGDAHYLIGIVKARQMLNDEAIESLTTALEIFQSELGPQHPDVGQTLSALSAVYVQAGRNRDAADAITRALAVQRAALGPDHPSVASSLYQLSHVYIALGEFDNAETAVNEALRIMTNVTPGSAAVAQALLVLSTVYRNQERPAMAEEVTVRAIDILEALPAGQDRDIALATLRLADIYAEQTRYSEAESLYRQVLAAFAELDDRESGAAATERFGDMLRGMGRVGEADSLAIVAAALRDSGKP